MKCLKTVWSGLFIHQHCSRLVCTAWVGMESCSRILIVAVYFKDQSWIAKTHHCINCSVVCKIVFCSKFPDIWDNAGRKTRRRRTPAIAKRYAFYANAKNIFCYSKVCFFYIFCYNIWTRLCCHIELKLFVMVAQTVWIRSLNSSHLFILLSFYE